MSWECRGRCRTLKLRLRLGTTFAGREGPTMHKEHSCNFTQCTKENKKVLQLGCTWIGLSASGSSVVTISGPYGAGIFPVVASGW